MEPLHQRQSRFDFGLVHQRCGQISGQLPRPRPGDCPVNLGEQRSRTTAFARGVDFETVASRLIDEQMFMHFAPHWQLQKRHVALPGVSEIGDQPARRRQFSARQWPDDVQCRKRKMLLERCFAGGTVEIGARASDWLGDPAKSNRHDNFAGGQTCKFSLKRTRRNRHQLKIAG